MAHKKLEQLAVDFLNEHEHVNKLNLTSVDGFTIYTHQKGDVHYETDKISAIASSLASLCHATTNQLLDADLSNTTIETQNGNMIIIHTKFMNKPAILSVITDDRFNLGQIRLYSIALATSITELTSLKAVAKIHKLA